MTEKVVDRKAVETNAHEVVTKLTEASENRERTYPSNIDAVWVFSGPGTYNQRLKPDSGEEEWMRWMDRDRIRAGVAVVREITATRVSEIEARKVNPSELKSEDMVKLSPLFVYNGKPVENAILDEQLSKRATLIPRQKVLIIREVQEGGGGTHPIGHYGDQFTSFFQQLDNPESPINEEYTRKLQQGKSFKVALVSHKLDFIRIAFYAEKYNQEFVENGRQPLDFHVYGLRSRAGTEGEHVEYELPRLLDYAEQGHLAKEPVNFSV